jgi:hypothetical protein
VAKLDMKFKNETEALAWATFCAGVAVDCDEDEGEEILEEAAKQADKMLALHFRKRAER